CRFLDAHPAMNRFDGGVTGRELRIEDLHVHDVRRYARRDGIDAVFRQYLGNLRPRVRDSAGCLLDRVEADDHQIALERFAQHLGLTLVALDVTAHTFAILAERAGDETAIQV